MYSTSVSREEFEEYVVDAVGLLPEKIRTKMENVELVVEEGESPGGRLLGLYFGVPQTKRGNNYSFVLPDKITLYKATIERSAGHKAYIRGLVIRVVWHEIGHHFGYSEPEIRQLEDKWIEKGIL